jgi:hypothetical protein
MNDLVHDRYGQIPDDYAASDYAAIFTSTLPFVCGRRGLVSRCPVSSVWHGSPPIGKGSEYGFNGLTATSGEQNCWPVVGQFQ